MTAPTLREVRRGTEPDELLLVDTAGKVIILRGYDGISKDEAVRFCERAFALLGGAES